MRKLLIALTFLIGLTACGGGAATTSTLAADLPTLTVEGRSFGSVPEVAAGGSFNIDNKDSSRHTFTSADDSWPEVKLPANATVVFTVPGSLAPGRYVFICTVHGDMSGAFTIAG